MSRRKPMQVSIETILQAHGKLGDFSAAFILDRDFHLKLKMDNYMPLVIEKVGPDRISICHYFVVNGDVMYDPEIVFSYRPDIPDCDWVPLEITQPTAYIFGRVCGGYRAKFFTRDGREMVDTSFAHDIAELVQVWARNLRHQGWDEAEVIS